jgi:DNA-binding response OmpR family regulator
MNAPPSEGSESAVDIFVLSKNQTEVPARLAPLEQKGYRITCFDDPPVLIESLREGKPNILICDTLSFPEAYDLCRHIKDDSDLWVIPVLILTPASDLSDLLHILDCNGDNFIAYPYDPDYILSLIESMLSTPVERQTPDQIKTQFKIQHDDRIFVVTADRRKLLEFLLSSFEIAVSKFHDLSRTQDEVHVLSDDVKRLGMFVDGQKQTVEELTSSLREKEQANRILEETRLENERVLLGKSGEIDRLTRELESDQALLGAAEDQLRSLIRDKEESERQSVTEIADLQQKVTSLSADLAETTAALQESRDAHILEKSGRAEVHASLAETTLAKEQAEKSLRAKTLENEQMKVSLADEKNHAVAVGQELQSVLLAKAQSEQDLTSIITELKETAKQQASDLLRQNSDLDDGKTRILNLGIQLGNLNGEKEQAEAALRITIERLQQDLAGTREKLDAAQADLEERDLEIERLNVAYTAIVEEHNKTGSELQSLSEELRNARQVTGEKDLEIERLNVAYTAIVDERNKTGSELQSLSVELRTARQITGEKDLEIERLNAANTAIVDERSKTGSELQTLSEELQTVRQALNDEKERHRATDENLNAVIRERDAALQSLQESHQSVQADLAEHRDDLARARNDLASAGASRSTLERDLETVSERVRELESQIHNERSGLDLAAQQARSLSEELEEVKGALENERRMHYATVESLRSAVLEKEHYEQSLATINGQLESTRALLASEKELRTLAESESGNLRHKLMSAEEDGRSHDAPLSATIEALKAELSSANNRYQELESRVQQHLHEKMQAEEKASSLAAEIDQARTALADEWEDHMNDHERLTVAVQEKQQLEKSLSPADVPETEKARKRALIIKGPDLPMEIGSGPRALTIPGTPAEPPSDVKRITGVEDLFEDDDPDPDAQPVVSIIQEPSGDADWAPPESLLVPYPGPVSSPLYGEDSPGVCGDLDSEGEDTDDLTGGEVVSDEDRERADDPDEDTEPNGGDETEAVPEDPEPGDETGDSTDALPPGISFNRAQWFDLLKWAHHSGALTPEQRMQIVRMGRLIQKGRRLTRKQDEQVREMIALVHALGYRFT